MHECLVGQVALAEHRCVALGAGAASLGVALAARLAVLEPEVHRSGARVRPGLEHAGVGHAHAVAGVAVLLLVVATPALDIRDLDRLQ